MIIYVIIIKYTYCCYVLFVYYIYYLYINKSVLVFTYIYLYLLHLQIGSQLAWKRKLCFRWPPPRTESGKQQWLYKPLLNKWTSQITGYWREQRLFTSLVPEAATDTCDFHSGLAKTPFKRCPFKIVTLSKDRIPNPRQGFRKPVCPSPRPRPSAPQLWYPLLVPGP